eukprot:5188142-Prymnesium_polylepis.1
MTESNKQSFHHYSRATDGLERGLAQVVNVPHTDSNVLAFVPIDPTAGCAYCPRCATGAALHKYSNTKTKPTSLGIVPSRCVAGRRQLEAHDPDEVCKYHANKSTRGHEAPLDKHHTHFIFVDAGDKAGWGSEIET